MDKLNKFFEFLDHYSQKLTATFVYGILSAIAMNTFFRAGNVYSSGIGGVSQIISHLLQQNLGLNISVQLILWLINLPLFILAWLKISHQFTIFTFMTVTLSVVFMKIVPIQSLTNDHIINAIFGGAINGLGIGYALKNGLSSGGLDIISLTIRKKTGKSVGIISIGFNFLIVCVAGILFGWRFALYTILTIFVSGQVTDTIFTKQKKIQVMIISKEADKVANMIQDRLHRGVTIVRSAEGAYTHTPQSIVITVIIAPEIATIKRIMRFADPGAFVSIQENVKIMGNFYEEEM